MIAKIGAWYAHVHWERRQGG